MKKHRKLTNIKLAALATVALLTSLLPLSLQEANLEAEAFSYGAWSDWSTTNPGTAWNMQVEKTTQWYYRDKTFYNSTAWTIEGYTRGPVVGDVPEKKSDGTDWWRVKEYATFDYCGWLPTIDEVWQAGISQSSYVTQQLQADDNYWYDGSKSNAGYEMSYESGGYKDPGGNPNHCANDKKWKYDLNVGNSVQVYDRHRMTLLILPIYEHWKWINGGAYTYTTTYPGEVKGREINSQTIYRYRFVADSTAPTGNCWSGNMTRDGYDVYCDVWDDNAGISEVRFATWSEGGGQNDLKWVTGTLSNQTVSEGVVRYARAHFRMNRSNWGGKFDKYITHVYAKDNYSNEAYIGGVNADLRDKTSPGVSINVTTEAWTNQNVQVTINAWDDPGGSGVEYLYYRINGGQWIAISSGHTFTLSSEGVYKIEAQANDRSQNWSAILSKTVHIDKSRPGASVTINPSGWTAQNVAVTINGWDSGGSGLKSLRYRVNNGGWTQVSNGHTFTLTNQGIYTVEAQAQDGTDAWSDIVGNKAFIDKTPPTASVTVGTENWTNQDVRVTINGYDTGGSELEGLWYRINGGNWIPVANGYSFVLSNEGIYRIEAQSQDRAKSWSGVSPAKTVRIDKTRPTSGVTVETEEWTNKPVNVVINGSDTGGSELHGLWYRINSGVWNSVGAGYRFTLTNQGTYVIESQSQDGANNWSGVSASKTVRIDKTNPSGSIVIAQGQDYLNDEKTTLTLNFADDYSGVCKLRIYDVGGTYDKTFSKPTGNSMTIPWVLTPVENAAGALVAQVGLEVTDCGGNIIGTRSQMVDIIKVYVTEFYLTDVVNPLVYNDKTPFVQLKYPSISPQPLLSGGSFVYQFSYYHPKNVTVLWKIDYLVNVRYQKPNGSEYAVIQQNLKQPVMGAFTTQQVIPYDLPVGTKVWLDIQLILYDHTGRRVAEGYFPQPSNTSLLVGVIESDIRTMLQFNEVY